MGSGVPAGYGTVRARRFEWQLTGVQDVNRLYAPAGVAAALCHASLTSYRWPFSYVLTKQGGRFV